MQPTHFPSPVTAEAHQALTRPRTCLWLPPTLSVIHLAIHKDVKANPKHLEEMPVVGPILHIVLGKPGGRSELQGVTEKHSRASGLQGPFEAHEDSAYPQYYREGEPQAGSQASCRECCPPPSP